MPTSTVIIDFAMYDPDLGDAGVPTFSLDDACPFSIDSSSGKILTPSTKRSDDHLVTCQVTAADNGGGVEAKSTVIALNVYFNTAPAVANKHGYISDWTCASPSTIEDVVGLVGEDEEKDALGIAITSVPVDIVWFVSFSTTNTTNVRCAFSKRILHSRMPLDPPPARLPILHVCGQ